MQYNQSMELQPSQKDSLFSLPPEIWEKIFEYLNASELLSCRLVSSNWNEFLYSSTLLWNKIFKMNGLVYTEVLGCRKMDTYRHVLSLMKARLTEMKLGRCFLLESLPRRMDNSYFRYNIQAFYCHWPLVGVATLDGLVRIYDVNRTTVQVSQIELFNFIHQPFSIVSLRLDDENVVVLEEKGRIVAWNAYNGQCVAKSCFQNAVSFDLLKGTLIVACGLIGCVKIIDLIHNKSVSVKTRDSKNIFQVILTQHWLEKQESQPRTIFLFYADKRKVYVVKIVNFTSATKTEAIPVTLLHVFEYKCYSKLYDFSKIKRFGVYYMCYDGSKYLYIPIFSPFSRPTKIYRCNIQSGQLKLIDFEFQLHQLVGVGKKYLVFTTIGENASLRAIDLHTNECRIIYPLTSGIGVDSSILDIYGNVEHQKACLGEMSWLDGFNGFNDRGLICVYLQSRYTLKLLRWTERSS